MSYEDLQFGALTVVHHLSMADGRGYGPPTRGSYLPNEIIKFRVWMIVYKTPAQQASFDTDRDLSQ